MDDTLLRLLHHDKATDSLAGDVDVDGAGALNLGDIEADLGEVTSGLAISALLKTTLTGAGAVQAVDGAAGRAGELTTGHAPVLKTGIGVAEVSDAVDGAGGVETAAGSVEGLKRRARGDASTLRSRVTRATAVGAGEGGLVGVHELPVGPETVDVGVVHPEDGVKARELGHQELTSTGSIPVNGVVDLLQRGTAVASGSKLVEASRVGEDIVGPLLVGSLAEEAVGGRGEAVRSRASVHARAVLVVPLSVLASNGVLGEGVGVEGVLHVDSLEAAAVGDLDVDHLGNNGVGDAVDGPVPVGRSESVGGIDVLLTVLGRVEVRESLGVLDEDLLKEQDVGTVPGQEQAFLGGVSGRIERGQC